MIQIKVISSPDKDKIGLFTFYKNLIYIGNSPLCDLMIFDSRLLKNHLILEIADGNKFVHPGKSLDFFLVNGKRFSSHKTLNLGDKIEIGDSVLTVEQMQESIITPYKKKLNEITDDLINSHSPVIELIQKLQNENL